MSSKIEELSKDIIDIEYVKDVLMDLIDEDFRIDWDSRIFEKLKYKEEYIYPEAKYAERFNREDMEYILFPDREYFIGFTIVIYAPINSNSSENLTDSLRRGIKLIKDRGFEFLRAVKDFGVNPNLHSIYTIPIDSVSILSGKISGMIDKKLEERIDSIDLFFLDPSRNFELSQKEVFEYYGWTGYSIDEDDKIYFEIPYRNIIPYIIKNSDKYVDILSEDDISLKGYYSIYYRPSNDDIHYYVNNDVIKEIVKYINKKYSSDLGIEDEYQIKGWKWWKEFNSYISILSRENDKILSEIKQIIADHSSQAHEATNIREIENAFLSSMKDIIKYKIYTKEREKMIKVYFDPEWIHNVSPYGSSDIIDFFNEWSYDLRTDLNPVLSDCGDIDKNEISLEILQLFK